MHASLCLFIRRSEQLPIALLARVLEAIVDAGHRRAAGVVRREDHRGTGCYVHVPRPTELA